MKPTKKQLELLEALNPFKGSYVTYEEAAKILTITVSGVKKRMSRLKQCSPEVYWNFKKLRKDMNEGQRAVKYPIVMDPNEINDLYGYNKVKEIF